VVVLAVYAKEFGIIVDDDVYVVAVIEKKIVSIKIKLLK
jgi:hypothetical protein